MTDLIKKACTQQDVSRTLQVMIEVDFCKAKQQQKSEVHLSKQC